jgi:amino acid permease
MNNTGYNYDPAREYGADFWDMYKYYLIGWLIISYFILFMFFGLYLVIFLTCVISDPWIGIPVALFSWTFIPPFIPSLFRYFDEERREKT